MKLMDLLAGIYRAVAERRDYESVLASRRTKAEEGEAARCSAPGFLDTRGGYQDIAPTLDRRS